MKLIIAEKNSLARTIVDSIGKNEFQKQDGYFENCEYIVTWALGHLFSLYELEEYYPKANQEEHKKWTLENLPFCPTEFKYSLRIDKKTKKVDPGIRRQFGIIKKLCDRKDVDTVIHAGDADREGEIIIRIILDQAKCKKPVKRLWLPEQVPETILSELRALKDDSLYNNLANEGYARTQIDWIYGINLTRLATLKGGKLLRVGRVIVPIVKAIYDRDMEIKDFVPQKYYVVSSKTETKGNVVELTDKKKFAAADKEAASFLCDKYNKAGAKVTEVKKEKKEIKPGKLYSLSTLQGVLGTKYKMAPNESLAIVQSLYDSGYITYPRTNSEYLSNAESGKINAILDKLKESGYKVKSKDNNKSIYDDSKIESHSALTPTLKFPKEANLTDKEQKVYKTIFNRFLAVFCSDPCIVNRSTMTIEINGGLETFKLTGDIMIDKGWMEYDDSNHREKTLPDLHEGDDVTLNFRPILKETTPPKHYTVKSLLDYLNSPFKKQRADIDEAEGETDASFQSEDQEVSDDEDYKAMLDGVEIGTEATRTPIITNAINSEYIALKKGVYTILPGGIYLIESLQKMGIHMEKEKTVQLGRALKRVYRGELSIEESVSMAFGEVKDYFKACEGVLLEKPAGKNLDKGTSALLGLCPKCKSPVIEREKGFMCSSKECKFVIWKDNRLFAAIGKKITGPMVTRMLAKGYVKLKDCVSQKSGKKFDCTVYVDFSGQYPDFKMDFDKSSGKRN